MSAPVLQCSCFCSLLASQALSAAFPTTSSGFPVGADAVWKSTQLADWLCSRILKVWRVCPPHLLTQLTTSPTSHSICWRKGLILDFMLSHDELLQVEVDRWITRTQLNPNPHQRPGPADVSIWLMLQGFPPPSEQRWSRLYSMIVYAFPHLKTQPGCFWLFFV